MRGWARTTSTSTACFPGSSHFIMNVCVDVAKARPTKASLPRRPSISFGTDTRALFIRSQCDCAPNPHFNIRRSLALQAYLHRCRAAIMGEELANTESNDNAHESMRSLIVAAENIEGLDAVEYDTIKVEISVSGEETAQSQVLHPQSARFEASIPIRPTAGEAQWLLDTNVSVAIFKISTERKKEIQTKVAHTSFSLESHVIENEAVQEHTVPLAWVDGQGQADTSRSTSSVPEATHEIARPSEAFVSVRTVLPSSPLSMEDAIDGVVLYARPAALSKLPRPWAAPAADSAEVPASCFEVTLGAFGKLSSTFEASHFVRVPRRHGASSTNIHANTELDTPAGHDDSQLPPAQEAAEQQFPQVPSNQMEQDTDVLFESAVMKIFISASNIERVRQTLRSLCRDESISNVRAEVARYVIGKGGRKERVANGIATVSLRPLAQLGETSFDLSSQITDSVHPDELTGNEPQFNSRGATKKAKDEKTESRVLFADGPVTLRLQVTTSKPIIAPPPLLAPPTTIPKELLDAKTELERTAMQVTQSPVQQLETEVLQIAHELTAMWKLTAPNIEHGVHPLQDDEAIQGLTPAERLILELNRSGKAIELKERLKSSVARIAREHADYHRIASSSAESSAFLNTLYASVLESIHDVLHRASHGTAISNPRQKGAESNAIRSLGRHAAEHEAAGLVVAAEAYHKRRIALSDTSATLWKEYGLFAARVGRFDRAEECLRRAAALMEKDANVLVKLAALAMHRCAYGSARQLIDRALLIDPTRAEAWLVSALLHRRNTQADDQSKHTAVEHEREASRLIEEAACADEAPAGDAGALLGHQAHQAILLNVFLSVNCIELACKHADVLLQSTDDQADPGLSLRVHLAVAEAASLACASNPDAAETARIHARKALSFDPASAIAYVTLGNVHWYTGDRVAAKRAYSAAIACKRAERASSTVRDDRERELWESSNPNVVDARRLYVPILSDNSERQIWIVLLRLAQLQRDTLEWEKAAASLYACVEQRPDSALAWQDLGEALLERSEHALAESALAQSTTLNPERSEAWLLLSRCLGEQQRSKEAQSAYREAVACGLDNPNLLTRLAETFQALHEFRMVQVTAEACLELSPPNKDEVQILLAKSLQQQFKFEEAKSVLSDPLSSTLESVRLHAQRVWEEIEAAAGRGILQH